MALTKVTLSVDQLSLNAVMGALQAQQQYLAALVSELSGQVREQVQADELATQKKTKRESAKKLNGNDRQAHGSTGPPA